jgi:ribosome-binding factor A
MKEFSRTRRVGVQIQRELADIIRREIVNPHLGMLTVSGVELSPDLKYARVYMTVFGEQQSIKHSIQHLNEAAGRLRYHLSQRLTTRTTPRLKFVHDNSIEESSRLSALIDSLAPNQTKKEDE